MDLTAGLGAFAAWPRQNHLAACAALALLIALRWHGALLQDVPALDEQVYLRAFVHVAEGRSPYHEAIFLYPPPIAHAGARLAEAVGVERTAAVLRGSNLLGLTLWLWLATAWWPLPMKARWAGAALVALLSPGVGYGLLWMNLSLAALGLLGAGLYLWPRRPWSAGLLLAASTLVKPLAPAAVIALAAHRPAGGPFSWRAWRTAILAGGATLVAVIASPYAAEFLDRGGFQEHTSRTVSSRRLLASLGLDLDATWLSLVLVALFVLWLRRRPRSEVEATLAAPVAVVLATPILWVHTFLVTLPLQGAALALVWQRRREAGADASLLRRWLEPALVLTAVLSQHATNGVDGATLLPWLLPFALAVPLLVPWALYAYLSTSGRGAGPLGPRASRPL